MLQATALDAQEPGLRPASSKPKHSYTQLPQHELQPTCTSEKEQVVPEDRDCVVALGSLVGRPQRVRVPGDPHGAGS